LNLIRVMPAIGTEPLTSHERVASVPFAARGAPANIEEAILTIEQFNAFCAALPHASHAVQWGGKHVWKVADKMFAIGRSTDTDNVWVSFKCSPLMFEVLKDSPGVRPAPYLAAHGMSWLQRNATDTISDVALVDHIRESHRLVALGLPKKTQIELGLNDSALAAKSPRQRTTLSKQRSHPRGMS
jgi:predicted DNA-binding protein (MmcQ/YjbR family)